MIKKLFLLSLFLISSSIIAYSQEFGSWNAYPSFSTVNSISAGDDDVFVATLGGIFIVNNNEIGNLITSMEGLNRSDPSEIIFDEINDRLFAGYIDGIIDVIDFSTSNIERLEDIGRVDRFNTKSINDLSIDGERLYVATSFGIIVYNLNNLLVDESFVKIGSFEIGTQVNSIHINENIIYVATNQGVAIGDLGDNLVEGSNWIVYDETNGLPANVADDIIYFNDHVYVLMEGSVYKLEDSNWTIDSNFPTGENVSLEINANRQNMGVSTNTEIRIVDGDSNLQVLTPSMESTITGVKLVDDQIYVGSSNEGFIKYSELSNEPVSYLPTGPYLNFFSKTLVDENTIVATSTLAFPGPDPFNGIRGYYIYKDEVWNNFNRNTNDELNNFTVAYSVGMNDSSYYFGSWGNGIVRHSKQKNMISHYNGHNSNLMGVGSNPSNVVISALHSDSENNMWAISYLAEFPFYVQLKDTDEWIPFRGLSGSDHYFNLFIDSYDQKWISLITNTNSGLGLLVVDTGDPADPSDDQAVKLTSSVTNGNLPDEKINAIIQDKNNEIWIGTGRGIARFIFPELIIEGGAQERQAQWLINEDTTATSRFLLRDVNVTAMAVNDANQKWIGSENQGLWLLNAEGSRIEKRFTTANSPIISDNIKSISVNNQTGEVFIATDLGLVSFQDIPKSPVRKMESLKVFPNPFQYSKHSQIVIDGLSEETQIKILGIDGMVVNELTSRGGRINWDGYDYNGNKLGTGVYFIVAYESSGREKGMGKVVIVK